MMRYLYALLLLAFFSIAAKNKNTGWVSSIAQLSSSFKTPDFSSLLTKTDNKFVYGIIGDNYQRIRVKFISVSKDSIGNYVIYGKTMVKNNVYSFKGKLIITKITKHSLTSYGVDNEYKNKGIISQGIVTGNYLFAEDSTQSHTGIFKGKFTSHFYLTKENKVHYDDIELNADGYSNNQFTGVWISYNKRISKKCNWGDYRVPNAPGLDGGAGEFYPNDKYLSAGWQTVRDFGYNTPASIKASKEENREWWK